MKINVGYILNELQKAHRAKNESEDAENTERAAKRVARWCEVLSGIQSGALQIGARKPIQYPTWVTLEVVKICVWLYISARTRTCLLSSGVRAKRPFAYPHLIV